MPATTVRDFSGLAKFERANYAPSSATTLNSKSVLLTYIVFSNTDTVDLQVTLKDGDGNVMCNPTVVAGDLYVRELAQGWKFNNGVQINAANPSVVRYELLGYQLPR